MREILFRGKRKDNGEWVYGSLVHIGNYCAIIQHDQDSLSVFNQVYLDCELGTIDGMGTIVIPETVGQYTGLKDKNGKKIFEGDVMFNGGNVVDFCVGCFCINGDSLLAAWTRYDVIGNIHDNPELLEV